MKNPYSFLLRPLLAGLFAKFGGGSTHRASMFAWVLAALIPCAHAQMNTLPNVSDPWQPGQLNSILTQSDPHNDVRKLLRQAKFADALTLIEKALQKNPRDPQMRFWQAFVFEQTNNANMAQQIYVALTQEYPELAEPHNNLGVMYAAQGEYDKARASLEAALRSNPNDATALENLGDVLLASAKQTYLRAQKVNPSSNALTKKLESLQPTLQRIERKQ